MGLNVQAAKMLLHENDYKEIYGRVLIVGRQTVTIDIPQIEEFFQGYGKSIKVSDEDIDSDTKASSSSRFIRDETFFRALSTKIESIEWLDVSDYEGASIIVDLNRPVPDELHGKYDFIYDGSVLDNVFNPAQFMENLALMLAPSGRICQINVTSAFPGAMVAAMPEYFYGFYAANDFDDVKVYVAQRETGGDRFAYPTKLWKYSPFFTREEDYDYMGGLKYNGPCCLHTICIAEKFSPTKGIVYPKNLQYVDEGKGDDDWSQKEHTYMKSDRPDYCEKIEKSEPPSTGEHLFLSDHYSLISENF